MSVSFGQSTKKTNSNSQTDPWDVTIPGLTDLINQIGGYQNNVGPTGTQSDAFAQLEQNAGQGNPYEGQIGNLAANLFGADSRSGQIEGAYNNLYNQLNPTASGANLDPSTNPYTSQMLQNNADAIQQRVNGMFAGAGRDLSGKNQQSLAKGISEGTIPALFSQYNQNVSNQMGAANQLFNAGSGAATSEQGLDTSALNTQQQGVPAAQAAIDAQNYGPNTLLQLEQQQKQLPAQDIGTWETLLGTLAQLGQQQQGTSKTNGSSWGGGIDLGTALGTLLTGSDENIKENKQEVGKLANGTPIYKFNYKNDPKKKTQIGVMAQDVEDDNPDAVADIGGVKFVDYDKATASSARKMKKGR